MNDKPLSGKTAVVFGVANKRSIAWAIAKAWADAGAKLIFNYQGERLKDNVEQLAGTFGEDVPLYPCDVTSDEELDAFFAKVKEHADTIDLVLHSVAFAPKEALEGDFLSTTREAFRVSHDISAFSLVALAQRAAPMMPDGGSIVAMSYYGAAKVVPNYNVMGVAKASLEASTRYLAYDLGPKENPGQLHQCRTGSDIGSAWHCGIWNDDQALRGARSLEAFLLDRRTRGDRGFPRK